MLPYWMLESDAYAALSGNAVKLLVALIHRFNGQNNGSISMSVREAEIEISCVRNTASRAFRDLQDKGFIELMVRGSFSQKNRHASLWRLTWLPVLSLSGAATMLSDKPFMRWKQDPASAPKFISRA